MNTDFLTKTPRPSVQSVIHFLDNAALACFDIFADVFAHCKFKIENLQFKI
jgi:hypothetical protein